MFRKTKSIKEKKPPSCSTLLVEGELIFCPSLNAPVRIGASVCELCNWKDKRKEAKLHKEFMKGMEKKT